MTLPRLLRLALRLATLPLYALYGVWALWGGSPATARVGFHRMAAIGVLRAFDRAQVSMPTWYGLAADAAPWVAEAIGCDEAELRVVSGIRRTNLEAVHQRNVLWVSL